MQILGKNCNVSEKKWKSPKNRPDFTFPEASDMTIKSMCPPSPFPNRFISPSFPLRQLTASFQKHILVVRFSMFLCSVNKLEIEKSPCPGQGCKKIYKGIHSTHTEISRVWMIPFSQNMPKCEFPKVVGCWNMWLKIQVFLKPPDTSRHQNASDLVPRITLKRQPNKYPAASKPSLLFPKCITSRLPDEKSRERQCPLSLLVEDTTTQEKHFKAQGASFTQRIWDTCMIYLLHS